MKAIKTGTALTLVALLTACAAQTQQGEHEGPAEKIFEIDITSDLALASGEPEIAVDPTNSRNLAIVEFALGSPKVPAWSLHPIIEARDAQAAEAMSNSGRVQLSNDGGNSWRVVPPPAYDLNKIGAGDPALAYGPDGALYVAAVPFPRNKGELGMMDKFSFVMSVSTDGGRTFSTPVDVPSPLDRPFIRVDQSSGTVYTAGTGPFNPTTMVREQAVEGAIQDRWLVAWKPHLAGHSEPRRMGGPDFSAAAGTTFTAAHGVVASAFVIGGPSVPNPAPVPASLRHLVNDGTEICTVRDPCLFFQTSSDEGRNWTRHYVPVPGGFSIDIFAYVAADPGQRGRYAIGLMSRDATGLRVLVTDDSGATWSNPSTVVEAPTAHRDSSIDNTSANSIFERGTIIRPWMEYGPTGVLGFMWKQRRDDVTGATPFSNQPARTTGAGFDVYAGISCDGGKTWRPPVRVNAVTSPPGSTALDDLSYIALDRRYAHLVWGDLRHTAEIKNTKMGIGGLQAYYGRVPFSVVTGGARCGRK